MKSATIAALQELCEALMHVYSGRSGTKAVVSAADRLKRVLDEEKGDESEAERKSE